MSTNTSTPPSRDPGQSVPNFMHRIRTRAAGREKISASDVNGDVFQGLREPIPNGTPNDNDLALNEIQLALSKISSSLGKLVPVERQHVVPPAIAAFVFIVSLVLIRLPIKIVISAVLLTVLLTTFAWPVWTTLKLMHHRIDEINVKMDGFREYMIESNELVQAVERRLAFDDGSVEYRPVEEVLPQPETLEPNAQPIEPREVPQPVSHDEFPMSFEEPEPFKVSVTPESERNDEPPATLNEAGPNSDTLEPMVSDEPPSSTDMPDPIPTLVEPSGQDEPNVDIPTVLVSPAPPEPAVHSEQAIDTPVEQRDQQPEPSFGHWSSTLLEIKQRIEPLASGTLKRLLSSDQREHFGFITLRRVSTRLLMYCASLSTADFTSPNGFFGPPTSVPYYPTGDLEDRNAAFTAALDCLDELMVLLTGNGKAEIAGALSELAQALSDLGLHEYASTVSGFALEIFRDLHAAEPGQYRSRLASIQSLRANIFADLRQDDAAVDAADESVTILKEDEVTQPELVYAMLNYAVLLGSIGRGDGALAVAFELVGLTDESINPRPDMILVSSLCRLCVSNACIEYDSDLALTEIDKAIEASRASLDANSKVVLAAALLTKSKILSSKGQNDSAYAISTEAVTLFRSASVDSHVTVFSFLLAHTITTHSHQLSEANRKGDSYSTINEAVELWQRLHTSAPVASKRPLAWALFELAKYRHKGADKQTLKNELQIAESAVSTFRDVSPLDYAGLADALYLYADRMLELDRNRDAATYAEESVLNFREANEKAPQKYALDLIFSLSLASSCLACTERSDDALEYAKQAVEVQHERMGEGDAQYSNHLRKLLMDVVFRSTEMGKQQDALPWMQELNQLGAPEDMGNTTGQLARRGGKPQPKNDTEFRKQTNYWMDASNSASKPNNGSASSAGAHTPARTSTPAPAPAPAPPLDKGKGREVTPPTVSSISAPRVDKGKAREVFPGIPFSPSSNAGRQSLAEEEILSPATAAAAQRRRDLLASAARGGSGNNMDPLSGLLGMGGMGGRTLGGGNNNDPFSSLLGGMGGLGGRTPTTRSSSPPPMGPAGRPLGSPIQQTARAPPPSGRAAGGRLSGMSGMAGLESLLSGLGGLGPGGGLGGLGGGGGFDPSMFGPEFFGQGNEKDKADGGNKDTTGTGTGDRDDTPRSGTWSGMGIQSKLSDDSA